MLKSFVTIPEEESKEIQIWLQENYSNTQNVPVDIMLLILYKIHLLEKKIFIIEEQIKMTKQNRD